MTIAEFLDRVPWARMSVFWPEGSIRHRDTFQCPISCVADCSHILNHEWERLAAEIGLSKSSAKKIVQAADGVGNPSAKIRAEMLRRIEAS